MPTTADQLMPRVDSVLGSESVDHFRQAHHQYTVVVCSKECLDLVATILRMIGSQTQTIVAVHAYRGALLVRVRELGLDV